MGIGVRCYRENNLIMGFGNFFKSIGKGIKKLHESDNPVLKGIRDFGEGMADAPDGSGVGERLANGGVGVGGGIIKNQLREKELEPVSKPKVMPKMTPQGGPRPRVEVEGIELDPFEKRRKQSAIMRGLNQMDDLGAER